MNVKTLNVFYGSDFLPYKDQERSVHYPVVGSDFQGANDITEIHFYIDRVCGIDTTFAVAIKLPNGKLGSKILSPATFDSALNENYVTLPISQFITQMVGGVTISLKAYQGDIELEYDDETELYSIPSNTPIIASTGIIKLNVNYATALDEGDLSEEIDMQALLGLLATKLNIVDGIITIGNISTANLSGYENGQLFYDRYTDTYYKKVATSPYYEKVNGKGVLGTPHILCRLREVNATIEEALTLYGNDMFVYNVAGKDYLFLVTKPSTFTAVAFDIETRRTYIRSGMHNTDTLDSAISSTYEADLDLGNRYVKTAGVKIGDIYHTIELVGGDMVIGSGLGDIWLQPNGTSKYITSRGEGDANKVEQYEISNVDFVLDQCLDISNMPILDDELELAYASRPNAVLKFSDLIYRHAYEDNTYIYFKCADDEKSTSLSGYDTYTLNSVIRIKKADGQVDRGSISFDFYNKTQSEGKFATNFTASLDNTNYVLTFTLKNANGSTLATQTIDLPLESIVTSMTYYDTYTYDGTTYHNVLVIVLATTSVPTIVPVGSLISGLEHEALVEVSDISTPLTASQLALLEYPNAMITYGNNVYLKAEDNGTYITLSVPYISLTTNSGHEEATRKFIVVTKSSGAMALTSDTTSFYNKSQTDTLLGEKADASSVVTDSDIETLGGAVTRIRKGNTWNEVAEQVDMSTTPKVVQSVADLPADNDGYLYVVLDNGYLYSWDEENQEWAQRYQYTSDLLTITHVEVGGDDYSYIEDKANDNRPIQVASASKDGNGDVIHETYAKISDIETIDERLDNHDTDIAKLKKDVDYAMKYPLLYGTPVTITEEEVGLTTSQLPATTLPKGLINYVGGMSQKVNQLVRNPIFVDENYWVFYGCVHSVSDNTLSFTCSQRYGQVRTTIPQMQEGHKYFVSVDVKLSSADAEIRVCMDLTGNTYAITIVSATTNWQRVSAVFEAVSGANGVKVVDYRTSGWDEIKVRNFFLIDLTEIYGAGNEPTSTSDPRIQWLISYLKNNPQYNEGSIVNAKVTNLLSTDGTNESNYPIPAEVKALEGYGMGINDEVYNYIDFERKKFVKKVGVVDLRTLNWVFSGYGDTGFWYEYLNDYKYQSSNSNTICDKFLATSISSTNTNIGYNIISNLSLRIRNGSSSTPPIGYFLYELDRPVETDISEYLDRDFPNENLIDTYQGGSVEFENENDMGVPYSLTYQYKVE